MGPNLESCALTRGNLRVALISQALIDKLQIIEWYNHRTKRVVCCHRMRALRPVIVVRSSVQKPATSARRDSARIDRPAPAAAAPEAAVPAGSTAGHPGYKAWQMPATAQQAPHPQADDSFAADDLLDPVAQRDLAKKPFRAIILAAASRRIVGCVLSGARRVHPVIVGWSTPQIAPSCPDPSMIIPDACSLPHGLGQLRTNWVVERSS